MGEITFLNCLGDVTITWDEKDDKKMKKQIEKLLKEGHIFFIVKKKFLVFNKEVEVKDTSEIKDKVLVKDDKLAELLLKVKSGKTLPKSKDDTYDVVKGSKDSEEIVKGTAICIKPSRGG